MMAKRLIHHGFCRQEKRIRDFDIFEQEVLDLGLPDRELL